MTPTTSTTMTTTTTTTTTPTTTTTTTTTTIMNHHGIYLTSTVMEQRVQCGTVHGVIKGIDVTNMVTLLLYHAQVRNASTLT